MEKGDGNQGPSRKSNYDDLPEWLREDIEREDEELRRNGGSALEFRRHEDGTEELNLSGFSAKESAACIAAFASRDRSMQPNPEIEENPFGRRRVTVFISKRPSKPEPAETTLTPEQEQDLKDKLKGDLDLCRPQ